MHSDYFLYNLTKTKKIIHQYIDIRLKEEGFDDLVSAYVDIITVLFINDGKLRMNEISEMIGKDKSTVTVLINRLIEKAYVFKTQSLKDKRVYYVNLTEKSLNKKHVFDQLSNEIKSLAFKGLSDRETDVFESTLKKIQLSVLKEVERKKYES